MVVYTSEPVDAVISPAGNLGVEPPKLRHIVATTFDSDISGINEWWIADDNVRRRPWCGNYAATTRSNCRDQGIHCFEVRVEIVQRQVRLVGDVQLVDGELAADHHADLGQ